MNTPLDFRKIQKIAKALGNSVRIRIIQAVRKEQSWMECSSVVAMLSLSQSTVSHHLKLLVEAEILMADKHGRNVRYVLNKETLADFTRYLNRFDK
jgi:ArsR family transcriptional regulator